jgi:2-C-methyl-D-erythritol 4-phosphate cytidylyltransferase
VANGLNALSSRAKLAAIQDGARPLVTWQVIDRVARAANSYGAAAPGIPVKDTIRRGDKVYKVIDAVI